MFRVGLGYDVHRLVEGRKLILGGVEIPYDKGLLGHSDADVLLHAIKDSLLGAAALGDIGKHFPDSDEEYRGADSMMLLAEVYRLLADQNYVVNNVDATIIAEKPKMAPYIKEMRINIATTLHLQVEQVNVKATTTEGLGFAGKGEGIAAQAISSIIYKTNLEGR
ncbi:2-C-methyl-D-erythritol 2,4-cyclodiphosphate synthase [Alkaliphilus peptidifermentans]|uniref:2-C-methyl-D-erythritol 2,4-cyclodiphosphate synthase n=1 Tax=Alkaliphilus peptidifermentans DSM 18978 TaxID=1120976 RepID=A0A1G5KY42_9FIRM|nr:2-C-methyl-D-erythritol 2,4-cyclodiphosphate synthase [Alkaliphilus peptidifermentans]SCZ05603.1 2-C-methyl-D-erythritol 2,4-cyclodiphosphate synthase [Alkaliphilus peptidifermentans DSM 18978]